MTIGRKSEGPIHVDTWGKSYRTEETAGAKALGWLQAWALQLYLECIRGTAWSRSSRPPAQTVLSPQPDTSPECNLQKGDNRTGVPLPAIAASSATVTTLRPPAEEQERVPPHLGLGGLTTISPTVLPSSWHLRSKLRPREERRIAQSSMLCKGQRQALNPVFLTQPLRGMKMLREVEAVDKEPQFLCSLSCKAGVPNLQDLMPDDLRSDGHGHDQGASTVVGLAMRKRNLQCQTKDFIWTRTILNAYAFDLK
ncbi:uncharacterized protein LOC123330807 [Bubalus bubalis]|uniref:uncharacterized protein LOC123330807 n=1 Tax=Bubalus bubalis TaxID=89462 RepID=UPI001E1B8B41|nr:uncharacterized protein LOC123330807 [Bubalus bubalis]